VQARIRNAMWKDISFTSFLCLSQESSQTKSFGRRGSFTPLVACQINLYVNYVFK